MTMIPFFSRRSNVKSSSIHFATKAVVDQLEQRQFFDSTLAISGFVVNTRTNSDGSPRNFSAVTVTFSGNVNYTAGQHSRVRISAAGLNLISGAEQRYSMRATGGSTVSGRPNQLSFNFGSIISNNARFNIEAGAIRDTTNQNVTRTSSALDNKVRTNVSREQATLAQRVWRPTDFTLFDRSNFGASPVSTTANVSPNAGTVRTNLSTFFSAKVTRGIITASQRTTALSQFDSSANIAIVPDANLRAAIVSLTGTVAEAAINAYFGTANTTGRTWSSVAADATRFGADARYAETRVTSTGRLQTILNPIYQGEDFRSLSALFAHEALHQDSPNSIREETVTNAIETLVWAQQLDVDQGPADNGTQLVSRQNFRLLSMLNSGKASFPAVGLGASPLRSPAGGVLAGGTPVGGNSGASVASFIADLDVEYRGRGFGDFGNQPGNVTLNAYVNKAIGSTGRSFSFNDDTLNTLDRSQVVISPTLAVKLGRILKLQWAA